MQKRFRNYLAVLLTILVSLFAFSPAIAFAANTDVNGTSSRNSQLKQISKNKIKSEVNKAFEDDEFVEVLIEMNKQVNTKIASEKATKKLSSKATPYQTKIAKRFAVVDALKSTAKMTQKDLLDYLEKQQNIGKVKEFKSFYIVNMVYVKTTKEVVEELSYRTEIKSINLNNKIEMDWPTISKTNNIKTNNINSDDSIEWGLKNIEVPAVWDTYGIYGDGVVVGVIDTGFEWEHEALQSKWRGFNPDDPANPTTEGNWFDAVNGQEMPYDIAEIPHGSHVTGTILGQDPDGENKIGVAPNAQFITAKAFTKDGGEDAWLIAAGEWMLAPNGDPSLAPDIINNSWGGDPGLNEWYRPMVEAWRHAGILPVFSAGNEPNGVPAPPASVEAPSNYPECFAVGATNVNNERGSFSRRGPGPYDGDLKPDVAAPGVNVRSSVPGGYEDGWNGTSMASPHVSGLAALLLSANASLTPDELEEIMAETATPITDDDYAEAPNYGYGHGIINAFNAVSSIASGLGVIKGNVLRDGSDVQEPTILNHVQLKDQYTGFNAEVEIEVEDDIAITNVELLLKVDGNPYWMIIPLNITSGDHKKGVYGGKIPGGLVQEPGFQYKIKVSDYGNNSVETDVYDVNVKFGEKPDEYSTDFSEEPSDWLIMNGEWQWGEPTTGPEIEDGNKLVATNLHADYSNNKDSMFVTPPLDLRDKEYAALTLKHWFKIADTYDKARVAITNDLGENWETVYEFTEGATEWKDLYVNLADYAKSPEPVFVAFVFQSSLYGAAEGWYLDDVNLLGEDNIAPQTPTNLQAEATTVGINLSWDKSDDVDIEKYEIYRSTTASGMSLELMGESQTTSYVDSTIEDGEAYKYSVKAFDYAGNVSEASDEVIIAAPSIVILYSYDFEENTEGWTSGGEENSWEWGVPTAGPESAFSGEKVWATNLSGDYENFSECWLESPEIDLTEVESADLAFKQWMITEAGYDTAYVEISTDNGQTWEKVLEQDGIKDSWDTVAIPLSKYTGNTVNIRFLLESDSLYTKKGWYVDDVTISSTTSSAITLETSSDVSNKVLEENKREYKVDKKINYSTEKGNYKVYTDNKTNVVRGLPVDAVVTVVESGRSMHVNPLNGSYRIMHPSNKEGESWTVRVDAYGYYPAEEQVQLEDKGEVIKNFVLDKIPTGTISGTILNERTGEPVVGAYVRVINDAKVVPVMTDENGNFTLSDVIQGDWTVKVTHGEYYEKEVQVHVNGNEATEVTVEMKPFIGFSDEIAYDDGTDENASVLNDAGNGFAVRMTPNGSTLLKGVNIKLYGEEWPTPGGNEFTMAAYDSKEDGTPGKMIFQTDIIEGIRGEWNYVDLSKYGFTTNKDFYLTTIQTKPGTESPGVCTDTSSSNGRSYMYVAGGFKLMEEDDGNVMMRAVVEYSLDCPSITVPINMTYTNNDKVTVSGTVNTDSEVKVYVNGALVETVQTTNKEFTSEVELTEGENKIYVTAEIESGETDPSQTIVVIKDTVNPKLNIETPVDGTVVNKEVVTVKGNVVDINIAEILVNGESVEFNKDGTFKTKIIVNDGENVIKIQAVDKAGNKESKEVKVTVNKNAPTITDITPGSDVIVKAGDEVKVSFHSDALGATAYFNIIASNNISVNSNNNGIQMVEVEPGFYEGSWVVPEGVALINGAIKVEITDVSGNHAEEIAPGTITTADNLSIPIEILGLNIKQQFGGTVVEAEIKNVNRVTQSPTLIIVVSDDQNRVVNISTANISELLPGKSIILGSGFNKPESGTYTVRALVWDTIENMESLAEPMEKPFVIE
ncbi:S8 family serine peptidase [Oceanirhabdus seepicola]|uniref:S8 family serine peptidase n=1 Tax=Oceanirhabdus seepicola TaxID=2828781 RepID=A0A9J6P176_9CLOT|nr:S8 family serine peptidase [Oceanirhabdus seepicola]MCM1990482.1 S8 family serine peptidase [Oceanirhabdus seepicola]